MSSLKVSGQVISCRLTQAMNARDANRMSPTELENRKSLHV